MLSFFSISDENKPNMMHGQYRFNTECEQKTMGSLTIPSINFDLTLIIFKVQPTPTLLPRGVPQKL